MPEPALKLTLAEARRYARDACLAAGASEEQAHSLAEATVAAEAIGRRAVGFAHLVDYLDGFREGRIVRGAEPTLESLLPALIAGDAQGGIMQLGFDRAFDRLVARAETFGVALFTLRNGYTSGEVGYYPRRLAERGLAAFACANGPALISVPGAGAKPIYCTNPFAFAAPVADRAPLLVDQSSSAAAFVELRRRAERGETLPDGWAVDATGEPTNDARAALKGALITFGGPRGANIALMVEVLAAAVAGGAWSLDAPPFDRGEKLPGAGLFVAAIHARALDDDLPKRLAAQLDRLAALGVHVPGRGREATAEIVIEAEVAARIVNAGR